jgi:CCR4-NOT transcription complex subunit 3
LCQQQKAGQAEIIHAAAPAAIVTTVTSALQLPQASAVSAESKDVTNHYVNALNYSFLHMPTGADSEQQKSYTPCNPYPTPSYYPQNLSPIFENPTEFEKFGTDALFFIFYYAQGTYQ